MSHIPPIFKRELMQKQFNERGFVKVSLLNEDQVQDLNDFFILNREEHFTIDKLHHTTTDTENLLLINHVDDKIKSILLPELEKILVSFKPLASCFHIKKQGAGSETGVHQDPTFVDEQNFCSANVWVALQDTNEKNGNLFFISGSNHAITSLRVTPSFPSYYDSFREIMPKLAVHVPLKKGEAVIFNNATIHGATENLSDEIRLAATLLICSERAQWLLYYQEEEKFSNKIGRYHLDLKTFF